ncbi:hypothetical protein M433DRAFT_69234 [Acidomyces richmondensis BFW]|nr:MAG: hypothetical protein FE78DRAFT_151646 [Acidomyces sp. 'richmondensis']KYG44526.1 hypothetical protein M433DRAFT_69234 [Acidomyces richmondensis BFW]
MIFARVPIFLAFLHVGLAKQPSAPKSITAPLRELPWGQLNFLHTTDLHGWYAGHLQEPQYSADWGDYISFTHHLRRRADEDGSDLLLIDSGDRVEGNGLYDASIPKGKYIPDIMKEQRMDVITIGNHELYVRNTSQREYDEVIPNFKDSYIASNVDIRSPKDGKLQAMAPRFRKFTTKNQGIRILAFGVLFNFHGNANNTVVQPVQEMIKEEWFQDAIRSKDVDLILVAGHIPVRDSPEFDLIYKAIRQVKWDTPIIFFGGHLHIRDYRKWEKRAQGIASGRYMETIGFVSISGLSGGGKDGKAVIDAFPTYKRMYIDNNLYSLHHHSGTNKSTFNTELGQNVSEAIRHDRRKLKLDHIFGCAPQDYWLNRAPYPSNSSILTWFNTEVIPDIYKGTTKPTIVIFNSGALRFDIFKGPFTTDTTFLVSPFTSGFRVLKDVPYGAASQILQLLNNEGPIILKDLIKFTGSGDGFVDRRLDELIPPLPPASLRHRKSYVSEESEPLVTRGQVPLSDINTEKPSVPGYTTHDDLGDDGDDTVHAPIQFYDAPNCIGANINFTPTGPEKPDTVDVAYNEFIEDWVILALEYLGQKREKAEAESAFGGKSVTSMISRWVHDHWACGN